MFQLRKDQDREKENRRRLQEQNDNLRVDVSNLRLEVDFLADKLDEEEKEKRRHDIVLDNIELIDDDGDVRPPSKCLQNIANKVLLGKVISDDDLIKTTVIKNVAPKK